MDYYTERLGFHVDWSVDGSGDDPYVCISRGGTEFHLTGCHCDDKRHVGNLWIRVGCDAIDELCEQYQAAGVNITEMPGDRPWGFREMEVEDSDGNRFTFFGPTTESES